MRSAQRHADVLLAALAGVATTFVLAGNIGRSFDYDESVAVWSIIRRGSPTAAFTETEVFNNHPIFSAAQSLWWAMGGVGETRQRLFPVLFGALAVALLVGWTTRRFGARAGVAAGLVLALNPMFVTQARAVRGYSLAVLGVTLSVICLLEYVRDPERRDRVAVWLLVGHAAGIVLAIGTHAVSIVTLGPVGLAALVLLGRVDRRLALSWLGAGLGVALVYGWTIEAILDTADARGNRYFGFLGRLTLEELLGRDRVTVTLHAGLLVVAAVVCAGRAPQLRTKWFVASILITVLLVAQFLFLWQIVQPFDLYPRFFLGVVPLMAMAIAAAVRHRGALLAVVVLGAAFVVDDVRSVREAQLGFRDAGAVVVAADGLGLRSCGVGSEAMLPYLAGVSVTEFDVPSDPETADFAACDLFVRTVSSGRPLDAVARDRYTHEIVLPGVWIFTDTPGGQLGR